MKGTFLLKKYSFKYVYSLFNEIIGDNSQSEQKHTTLNVPFVFTKKCLNVARPI
jgi:hypothetical protein